MIVQHSVLESPGQLLSQGMEGPPPPNSWQPSQRCDDVAGVGDQPLTFKLVTLSPASDPLAMQSTRPFTQGAKYNP